MSVTRRFVVVLLLILWRAVVGHDEYFIYTAKTEVLRPRDKHTPATDLNGWAFLFTTRVWLSEQLNMTGLARVVDSAIERERALINGGSWQK